MIPTFTQLSEKLQQAVQLHQAGQLTQAQSVYEDILAGDPKQLDAINLLGAIALQTGNPRRAAELYERAIEIDSNNVVAYCNSGLALRELKQFDAALARYKRAIEIKPDAAEAYFGRGNVLRDSGELEPALASYGQTIAIDSDHAEAHFNCGLVLQELKRLDAALASYNQAISLVADYEEAYLSRGVVLRELKQLDAALVSFNQAIEIRPDFADAYSYRGNVLRELRQLDAALASQDQAIAIRPDFAEAYLNRGNVLSEIGHLDAALADYERAIEIKPDFAEGYISRGHVLRGLEQLDAALASYNRAIEIKPDSADAYASRGHVLRELKQLDAALASYEHALALSPGHPWLYGTWLHTRMYLCDWKDLEGQIELLVTKIERAERGVQPFAVLGLVDSARLQRRAAEVWVREMCPANLALPPVGRRPRGKKIRIGYFSSDYYGHPVSYLAAQLFEMHDKERFHSVAFSFGPDRQDDMRKRLSVAFDSFIDLRAKPAREIALLSRELEIDIAVDLTGFTSNRKTEIFAYRAAPIQVNYLGYPGTMGAPYMDYIIADRVLIPEQSRPHYAEKVVYLPHSYQVNDRSRQIADRMIQRQELGLPPNGFVFCCFNNSFKITPDVFDIWMRLLRHVDGSVLWLRHDGETAARNLRKEAIARGVRDERLIFAQRMSMVDHLARHRAADLFIDTLPYNAHTTASDALWGGLPVLTHIGESYAARVAASLLNAIGLPELITTTAKQYEATALALATDPARLALIREKLQRHRLTMPLFDCEMFTRHLEQAYLQMYERYQQDLPPGDISISPPTS